MFATLLILAAGSLPLISGLPVPSTIFDQVEKASSTHFLQERSASTYTVYGGNGEVSNGWPSMSNWVSSYETMFNNNKPVMQKSCAQWNVPDNTDDEISEMEKSILSVASSTGIDARFILAIIMQESNGCVRAPTTNYGVRNPGLMQSHDGAGSCNDGSVQQPCPPSQINQMILDGSAGTSSGDGLKQCLAASGASDVSMYYKAARIYNSGSVAASGNLGGGIATACYATDIANRLTGWFTGPSACDPGTVAQLTGTTGAALPDNAPPGSPPTKTAPALAVVETGSPASGTAASSDVSGGPAFQPTSTASSADSKVAASGVVVVADASPTATASATTAAAAAAAATSTAPVVIPDGSSKASAAANPSSSAQVYPGATSTCQEWYTVEVGDYCIAVTQKFGISLEQLVSWNSGLDLACSNLWLAYQYCVKA